MKIGQMDKLIIHFVGNKNSGDGVRFSDTLTNFETIDEYIKKLIEFNFKLEELFCFHSIPSFELNPLYQFVNSMFCDNDLFINQSQNCARYLYEKSTHPHIKVGELFMLYIKDCEINGEQTDAICMFKSENKDTILKISKSDNGFNLNDEKGININKLDKGCLIFNTHKENGYMMAIVDNTNRSVEAQYWKEQFLNAQPIKNEFHETKQFLGIAKQFVTKQLAEDFEITKADQIDFLNRSVNYFKNHEYFDKREFEEKVFEDDDLIESFRNFDKIYRQDNNIASSDSFEISNKAVKKQARVFKSVLKLDKNFHIYIHGNKQLIEQGTDEKGRKFYKIYYDEET